VTAFDFDKKHPCQAEDKEPEEDPSHSPGSGSLFEANFPIEHGKTGETLLTVPRTRFSSRQRLLQFASDWS
jgi:hypothetical protein